MAPVRRAAWVLLVLVAATPAAGTGPGFLPPWWVLHKVKPEGKPKSHDHGSWTSVTFSKAQQEQFAVDEDGKVQDKAKFDLALQALREEHAKAEQTDNSASRRLMLPPWWLLNGVKPEGKEKDMGGWTAIAFSKEQQEQFSVDEDGEVKDAAKHEVALQALKADKNQNDEVVVTENSASRRLMLPPWWLLNGVKPEGKEKDMGVWTAITFSKEQQEQFAVDEVGEVKDAAKHEVALQALKADKKQNDEVVVPASATTAPAAQSGGFVQTLRSLFV